MLTVVLALLGKLLDVLVDLGFEVLAEVLAGTIVARIPALKGRLKIPVSIATHNRELVTRIREMPFLYKDLKEEILNDFAEIEIDPINLDTLEFMEKRCSRLQVNERLQISKKVLFLGNAGIGKTTFQRHSLLKIITDRPNVEFLYPDDNPVAFYVPLKVVDDSKPNPILTYILQSYGLFTAKNKSALKRLIKITKRRGIFLFIDGYDEIQFLGGRLGQNYLQDELNLMLKSDYFSPDKRIPKSPKNSDFYNALTNQRVWLASRREFFKQYPIQAVSMKYKSPGVFALAVKGVTEHRLRLVKNIFDQYPRYSTKLDGKYFIREIDKAEDRELVESSYNPLFLTIMAYVYVRKVIDHQTHKVRAARNYYALITEFIDLLLIRLDEGKLEGLGLSEPQKEAELSIRNSYVDEKKKFLSYFSAELFLDDKAVFDLLYIKDKTRSFFESFLESQNRDEILRGLDSDSMSAPNFAQQLTLQGLFVIVDKQQGTYVYDFPHRRFREVLAANHFIEIGPDFLLTNLHKPRLSELVLVFFGMAASRDLIMKVLLQSTINNSKPDYFQNLLLNCLSQAPADYNPTDALTVFLLECINHGNSFSLPAEVVDHSYFSPDSEFYRFLADQFRECVHSDRTVSLCLITDLLLRLKPELLDELVASSLLPYFGASSSSIQLALAFPQITDMLNRGGQPPSFLFAYSYLKSIFNDVAEVNSNIPYAEGRKPRSCYIVTDPVLKITERFIQRIDGGFGSNQLGDLASLKWQVHFTKDFVYDSMIRLDNAVRRFILRKSSIDYRQYWLVMKNIEDFRNNTLNRIRFFN